MRIKNLRIIGFKSFCQPTEISFHHGLNAIVGPNGCGKSNISDALKWIMGEHNVRQLRGDRLEDIIFAGSHEQKPHGMAEVTMTVENNGGGLPPQYQDFSEVEITRRVFRSGESEFFINKKPCLLKDLREIFMDTGLNPRAYSIIEQGSIMDIVNSSPQDLRKLVEEAAGITKYRERKAATIRKMEATRENLDRVNDIILEVQRQVKTTQRQANEAKRFLVFQRETGRMEAALYFLQYEDLRRRWEEAAAEHAERAGEGEKVRHRIAVAEARLEEGRVNLLTTEKELVAAQETYYRHSGRLEVTENQIRHLEERLKDHEESRRKAAASRVALGRRRLEVEAAHGQSVRDLAATEASLAAIEPLLEDGRRRERALEEEDARRRENHEARRRELGRISTEKVSLLEAVTSGEAKLAGDEHFLGACETEGRRLLGQRGEYEQALAALEESSMGTAQRLELASSRLSAAVDETALLEKGLEEEASGGREAARALTEAEGRLSSLRNLRQAGDNLKDGARGLYRLASGGAAGEGGFLGILGDLVRVDKEYRRAIEACLSDRLEAAMVRDEAAALSLAGKLKAEGSGTGTVIPEASWPKSVDDRPVPGTLGPAWRFVRTNNGFSGLIRRLLRDVYLVDDLGAALALWRSSAGGASFCTLDGDMVHAWGGITVGRAGAPAHGVLELAEEIESLEAQAAKLAQRRDRHDREADRLRQCLAEAKTAREAMEKEKHELERRRDGFLSESSRLGRELEQTALRLAGIEEEVRRRLADRERERASLASSRGRLQELAGRESGVARRLEELEREMTGADEGRRELRSRVAEMEVAQASLAQKKVSQEEARARWLHEAEEIRRGTEELKASEADLSRKSAEAAEGLETSRRQMEDLKASAARTGEEVDRLQGVHRDLSAAQAARGEELKELRRDWEGLSERLSAVGIQMAEYRTRMEETVSRCQAETGFDFSPEKIRELDDYPRQEPEVLRQRAHRLKGRMARIGPVNMTALEEISKLKERQTFMTTQKEDLEKAIESLHEAIRKINKTSRDRFAETYALVETKFTETFRTLFNGGEAVLQLEEGVDLLEAGILIFAKPPGKKMSKLNLLSGGEKAMTAIALLFAIFAVKPAPFCLMDEVDAPLDEVNIERFLKLIDDNLTGSQVVLITHNKQTMERASNLVGVTMESPGISKLVTVRLSGN